MKVMSFNCRGLASPLKKSSLRRLVELNQPDVILLQETLGCSEEVVRVLETLLSGWKFVAVDARGRSGGLASGWKVQSCRCDCSWGIYSGVGLLVWDSELGKALTILNIYGPYLNRASFWDTLFNLDLFEDTDVILGGDFNLTLGASEV